MGRQLQLATTRTDETQLLRFIASLAPIRVFQSFAVSQDALWVPNYENVDVQWPMLYIWPLTFPWSPIYAQTGGPGCPRECIGQFYIANSHIAPVLELSCSDLLRRRHGRIYWGRDFSAPNGLDYDGTAFSKFVDRVWRWIRKVGTRVSRDSLAPYYLPDAYKVHAGGNA